MIGGRILMEVRKSSSGSFKHHIFEGFNEQIKQGLLGLSGLYVVIVIPTLDKNMRLIRAYDEALFNAQKNDAHNLATYMIENMDVDSVTIPTDLYNMDITADCVILLHEFTDFDKSHVLEKLTENNTDLKYFELH